MPVDQYGLAMSRPRRLHPGGQLLMIGRMRSQNPVMRLGQRQTPVIECPPVTCQPGNDAIPRCRPGRNRSSGDAFDQDRIQIGRITVQIDPGAAEPAEHHRRTPGNAGRDQPIHQGVLGAAQAGLVQSRIAAHLRRIDRTRMG